MYNSRFDFVSDLFHADDDSDDCEQNILFTNTMGNSMPSCDPIRCVNSILCYALKLQTSPL